MKEDSLAIALIGGTIMTRGMLDFFFYMGPVGVHVFHQNRSEYKYVPVGVFARFVIKRLRSVIVEYLACICSAGEGSNA